MTWPEFSGIWKGILLILLPSDSFKPAVKTKKVLPWFWVLEPTLGCVLLKEADWLSKSVFLPDKVQAPDWLCPLGLSL